MATPNRGVLAFALTLLFLFSGPLSHFSLPNNFEIELDESNVFSSGGTDFTEVVISGPNSIGIGPNLALDATHALQTVSFSVSPGDDIRASGFNWSNWDQTGFSKQGLTLDDDGH